VPIWNFILLAGGLAASIGIWQRSTPSNRGECALGWIALGAGGLKLWLGRAQPLTAVPAAPWDDRLFLQLATSLLNGDWLGPYNRLTLAKGPLYPLFMASASLLHLPLITAQNLAYVAACACLVRALRPLNAPVWSRAILLLALIACPLLSDSGSFVRAWRQSLWPSLVLFSVAGTVGLALRENDRWPGQAKWALLAGGAVGAMWLEREEAVWTLPMLVLPLLLAAWRARHLAGGWIRWCWLLAPLPVALLVIELAAAQNYRAYRFWGVVEFRDAAFVSAYSALCRVEPVAAPSRRVPVTRAARERIYAVSPAFASLRHEIEDGIGAAFMKVTQDNTGIPATEHEIGGGWMMWTLRDAVANTGQATSAPAARAFYRQLAREVNAACDDGRLPALPRRHSLMPPWHWAYLPAVGAGAKISWAQIVGYHLSVDPMPSLGSPEDLAWVARVTHERISPVDPANPELRRPARLAILRILVTGYGAAVPWLLPAALLAWIALSARALYRREWRWPLILAAALALGIIGNGAVVALVNATSWPSISIGYLGASFPLAIGFIGLVLAEGASLGRRGGP